MTKVLIVGKTKKWKEVCVGGLVLDSLRSVRLLTESGDDQPEDTPFELGSVWEISFEESSCHQRANPHVEDVRIVGKQPVAGWLREKFVDFLVKRIDAPTVDPRYLFDGLVQFTENRKWYVAPDRGLPSYSTGFWRLRKALRLFWVYQYPESKPRYLYLDENAANPTFDVPYVGFEEPLEVIPRGTLVRFSLTRKYKGRFWLQLSGWFDEGNPKSSAKPRGFVPFRPS